MTLPLIFRTGYKHVPDSYSKPFSTDGLACTNCYNMTLSSYRCNNGLCDTCITGETCGEFQIYNYLLEIHLFN